ncbi:TIGR02921 family PEP-CTERM protein [Spirulina subsalsa FACHB-351]|uniref:TIGR02921 family PEP-CTERM protein n=1 Tax=Spirulina subsalsa FACHB-351 TaxID=234711 RepID=A0ABT3L100_9CYAN|nr:TIGR02921 family PEP-CTERM protein [Spirulina subsalsa]MCW6035168.1 TIGR02921 family PEP-CTERM protein [Spirulina subsalsa FACHB-351]
MKTFLHVSYYSIFWLWNLLFLMVVYLGIFPLIGVSLIAAIVAGEIEPEFLIALLAILLTPPLCTLIGLLKFQRRPLELMRLFYGVEAPIFTLAILRLFTLRELTGASYLIVGSLGICMIAFGVELLVGYLGQSDSKSTLVTRQRKILAMAQVALHSLMLLIGLYFGAVLFFYAVPVAGQLIIEFFSFRWVSALWYELTHYFFSTLWYIAFFSLFFVLSTTLFVLVPSSFTALYIHSGQRILRAFSAQYGKKRTLSITLGILTTWFVLFFSLQNQPQLKAFELLDQPVTNNADRQEIINQSPAIKKGLLNAYLQAYRYLGNAQDNDGIKVLYSNVFSLPEPLLDGLQAVHNQLLSPFLYQGSPRDEEKAAKLYAQVFDTSIQKGEQAAIIKALQSTAMIDEAKAGVLNINQHRVLLEKQAVTVKEEGDWAEVELYEVYQNVTNDVEEIFYSFTLPESAVLTGIWLGDTENLDQRFPFQVSPRGAAQRVYNAQVQRVNPVDPALLEQVGTRHYRLRAFPIPEKRQTWETEPVERPLKMHLWLTYRVMNQEAGWALPKLGEKRNIFWTKKTERWRNGERVKGFDQDWLEGFLPASAQGVKQSHQGTLNGYTVTAKPLSEGDYVLPQGQHFAVILDSSYSMESQRQAINKTLDWLKKEGFTDGRLENNEADLYLTATAEEEPQSFTKWQDFNLNKQVFYGTLQLDEMLAQFKALAGNKPYDGVIVLTDEGSYELAKDQETVPVMNAPLWVVHLGGFPEAYEDGVLQEIQRSGGGVAQTLPEVLQRMATTGKLGEDTIAVVDGYAWQKTTTLAEDSETGFMPLAARMLIKELTKGFTAPTVEDLDGVHAIAKETAIVTPYSSMIVLVNDEQRQALREAEASEDRFERQVEDGNQTLDKPNNPLQSNPSVGVPEGRMAIALTLVLLFFFLKRRPH